MESKGISYSRERPIFGGYVLIAGREEPSELGNNAITPTREVNKVDKNGQTVLFKAIMQGDKSAVETCLENEASVNQECKVPEFNLRLPPLCLAVRQEHVDITRLLLNAGADVEMMDNFCSTPLKYAINRGNSKLVTLLISYGCNVNAGSPDRFLTPLHSACARGKEDIVRILLGSGAVVNVTEATQRQTPAFFTASLTIMQLLVSHGLDVNLRSRSGEAVLHHAITSANEDLVRYLIECGSELNSSQVRYRLSTGNVLQMCYKQAPLRLAVEETYFNLCYHLIRHGCDLTFLCQTHADDTLSRIVNSGEFDLIMLTVHAAGNWNWTSLLQYDKLSKFQGQEQLDCIWSWLVSMSSNPFTLKALCRLSVRERLQDVCGGTSVMSRIHSLPLPRVLQLYCALNRF